MRRWIAPCLAILALLLSACGNMAPTRPASWAAPELVVAPSSFTGVHGLAIDKQGRLLAGSVVGNVIWEVDRQTGAAKILVNGPEGQADDIAIGPNGEMAWTNYLSGAIRYRENDNAPMRLLAQGLPGLNRSTLTAATASCMRRRCFWATRCGRSMWPASSRPG